MSIHRTEAAPGYPVLEIEHPAARARVALHGAHLMEWQPAGREPVLYLSPRAVYKTGKAIRGGVPVCWPWFGPHPADPARPAHGFVRSRMWALEAAEEHTEGVRLLFRITDSEETRALWPHAFRLTLEMQIGRELHLTLRAENTGAEPFTVTGALHTYFAAGDIAAVRVEGLEGTEYLDTLTQPPSVHRQEGPVVFPAEVDRNYAVSGPIRIHDASTGRTVHLHSTGSGTAVVWNPWVEKTRTLTDLPEDGFRHFVCVETANAWRDVVTVPPGGSHTLAAHIRTEE